MTPRKGVSTDEPLYMGVVRGVNRLLKEEELPRNKKTAEDEIDDLVDDLDELDEDDDTEVEVEVDEDEEIEDEVDEDEEDPDEAPKRKRSRSKKVTTKKVKAEKVGIGTAEVAAEAGIEPRQLRMFLRAKGYQPRDDRDGRYNWPSMKDPEVREILKAIKSGAADKMNKERLENLKEKKSTKSKKASAKKKARSSK